MTAVLEAAAAGAGYSVRLGLSRSSVPRAPGAPAVQSSSTVRCSGGCWARAAARGRMRASSFTVTIVAFCNFGPLWGARFSVCTWHSTRFTECRMLLPDKGMEVHLTKKQARRAHTATKAGTVPERLLTSIAHYRK